MFGQLGGGFGGYGGFPGQYGFGAGAPTPFNLPNAYGGAGINNVLDQAGFGLQNQIHNMTQQQNFRQQTRQLMNNEIINQQQQRQNLYLAMNDSQNRMLNDSMTNQLKNAGNVTRSIGQHM
ncbi:hypothetical protein [Veronia pacifica]|uniref:Uncharacterized protein n=1 Tax=Veronia pacifica TaxID=1080227 RepID=A0A1C3ER26_9GAMM|nr:hypothetical protein [Veronia pacifica]ODA35676.1 hypothetical protein A8L45_03415 [Veronia pacifica]